MQLAQVLADLSTLGLCGTDEALALVNQHTPKQEGTSHSPTRSKAEKDDLQRAKDLVRLHADMKAKMTRHVQTSPASQSRDVGNGVGVGVNVDADLMRLRGEVRRVREELEAGR